MYNTSVIMVYRTERPCFCDINERNYRIQRIEKKTLSNLYQLLATHAVHEGPNHATATWKRDFCPIFFCLFIYLFIYLFCHQHFSFYSFSFFWLSALFSLHIFPSISAIRRYLVFILQTPEVYSQNYLLWSNDRQQELHNLYDLYNARQDSLSNRL